jgi:hypothetical protein
MGNGNRQKGDDPCALTPAQFAATFSYADFADIG